MLSLVLAMVALACRSPGADPVRTGDPANGVTIDNATDRTVSIHYESPDNVTEALTELAPGSPIVIDQIFAGRDGICRTGRLVAHDAEGAEVDELYLVCRGGTWTIEAPWTWCPKTSLTNESPAKREPRDTGRCQGAPRARRLIAHIDRFAHPRA